MKRTKMMWSVKRYNTTFHGYLKRLGIVLIPLANFSGLLDVLLKPAATQRFFSPEDGSNMFQCSNSKA